MRINSHKKPTDFIILFIGAVCMTFSGLNWQIGILAWVAPVCLLYYTRNSGILRFLLFFVFISAAGYLSQSCNNPFYDFTYGLLSGLAYAIIHTIIYLIDKFLYDKSKGFYSTLIFPAVFVTIEYLVSLRIGTSGIVAQSQIAFKPLAQLSTITGIFGVTFVVIWFASVVNWIIENGFSRQAIRRSVLVYGTVFLFIALYGVFRASLQPGNTKAVKVATITGVTDFHGFVEKEYAALMELVNTPELEVPERMFSPKEHIRIQMAHTREAAKEGAKIIVWSEDALLISQGQKDTLIREIKTLSQKYNAYILLAFLEENNAPGSKLFNNQSVCVTPKGKVVWEYRKSHLASVECPIINQGNCKVPFFDTEYGRIGSVICYDLDFPTFLHQAGKNAIDILLVPAYDWKEYACLHSRMARFEALQRGCALVRANGLGINSVTDSRGNVIAEMNTFASNSKILYANLPLTRATTVYSSIGSLFVFLGMLFLLVILGVKISRKLSSFYASSGFN